MIPCKSIPDVAYAPSGLPIEALPPQWREVDPSVIECAHQRQRPFDARVAPAAMRRIERKLLLDILPGERLVRATAHVRLALLDHAAVVEHGADVTGEILRIWIVGIDLVAHLAGEGDHRRIAHRVVRKVAEADVSAHETRGDAVGRRELAGIAIGR